MKHVSWTVAVSVNDGEMDTFRSLMDDMVPATSQEQGSLTYDWFILGDGPDVHILERYADNDAALVHIGNFGAHFAERFMSCVTIQSFTVYGPVNDIIRDALTPLGAVFFDRLGGFRR